MTTPDGSPPAASKLRLAVFAAALVVLAILGVKLGGVLSGAAREATAQPSASAGLAPLAAPTSSGAREMAQATALSASAVAALSASAPAALSAVPRASAARTIAPRVLKPKPLRAVPPVPDSESDFGGRK